MNIGQGSTGTVKTSGPGLEKASSGQQTFFVVDTTEVASQTTALSIDIKTSKGQQVPFNSKILRPGVSEISYTPVNQTDDSLIITVNYKSEPVPGSPYKVPLSSISSGKFDFVLCEITN